MQLLRNKTIAQQLIPFCKLYVVAYEMKYENDKKNPEWYVNYWLTEDKKFSG